MAPHDRSQGQTILASAAEDDQLAGNYYSAVLSHRAHEEPDQPATDPLTEALHYGSLYFPGLQESWPSLGLDLNLANAVVLPESAWSGLQLTASSWEPLYHRSYDMPGLGHWMVGLNFAIDLLKRGFTGQIDREDGGALPALYEQGMRPVEEFHV